MIVLALWWLGIQQLRLLCSVSAVLQGWLWVAAVGHASVFAALVSLARHRQILLAEAGTSLSHARLGSIIRTTTEAILTIDTAQRIVLFNPMAEHVFRCPADDAIGSPLTRFIPERYRAEHARQVARFGRNSVTDRPMGARRVLFGLRADGEEFPIEASISQTEDNESKLFTVVLRDITERVEAEALLQQSREELRALSANLQHVREIEKGRVARALHDDIGQTLSALKMDVSALDAQLAAHPAYNADIGAQLTRMLSLVDRNIASLRRIAAYQRPVMLDDLGLAAAIDWLVDDFTRRHRIEVSQTVDTGDLIFNADAATAVFRIIEEAFTNIVRHASASTVDLSLHADDSKCTLRVGDNGVGAASLPAPIGKAFGLLGVRERAHALGGRVSIDSRPETGFVLTVVLPRESVREKDARP
ncbi:PAS domain-containing sensor histidine kinase [Caballeronia sp. BR00000012568055]|uniref:PAS domain-containing sensor histidine kinase n=1 Tax=Caballeronia sp. BR00000012568055 TaxID=2918761 RepID=UPI0023F91C0C